MYTLAENSQSLVTDSDGVEVQQFWSLLQLIDAFGLI